MSVCECLCVCVNVCVCVCVRVSVCVCVCVSVSSLSLPVWLYPIPFSLSLSCPLSQVEKPCSTNPAELLLYPAKESSSTPCTPTPTPPGGDRHSPLPQKQPRPRTPIVTTSAPTSQSPSAPTPTGGTPTPSLTPELRRNLGELLLKYSSGLWAHALPKLYQDTYKSALPEHVLQNLALLADFCTIDYPMPDNPKRAILYVRSAEDENSNRAELGDTRALAEVGKRLSCQPPVPALQIPREEYPSVLVVEAASTNRVVLR